MEKPPRTFWQIWNMSFGFLGIQFGWGLQKANMSAIYEYLGARADQIPILWLAAPLTGLIVQPIIGHASDHTWGPLGRVWSQRQIAFHEKAGRSQVFFPFFMGQVFPAELPLSPPFHPHSW
jgi:hypothetical protein